MELQKNIEAIKSTLATNVTLVAVSKTISVDRIQKAYDTGHRAFGENKIQELISKQELLPKDIRWHMIGHLQRNKVKYIAPFIHLIHGVDSFKTLQEINKQAVKNERVIHCLLQVKIAKETTKFGFSYSEIKELLLDDSLAELKNIKIVGFMGMATNNLGEENIRQEFKELYAFFKNSASNNQPNVKLEILSMGMSGDYKIAVEEGSTLVRIGSLLFGHRNYTKN